MSTATDQLNLISARLAEIGKSAAGVGMALDPPPPNPTTARLPLLYILNGSAQYNDTIADQVGTRRVFRVQVAVLPTGQGDPNTREKTCRPVLEAVVQKYQTYYRLHDLDFVERLRVVSDSGIVVLPEYGYKFIGFEIQIEVTYFAVRPFADDE